ADVLTATDSCSGVATVTYNGEVMTPGSCAGEYTLTRTWTASDACGNEDVYTQVITVVDTTSPVMDIDAQNMTVECDGAGNTADLTAWLANNGGAVATDTCGDVTWSNDFTGLSDECGATGSATVVFTATDECGNTSTTTATFTIVDTTAPVFDSTPGDITVECDSVPAADVLTATDSCSGVATVTYNGEVMTPGSCVGEYTLTRTWTASDACGNEDVHTQVITVVDTTTPVMDIDAQNMTVECDGAGNTADLTAWLANNGGAVATDTCGDVTWSNDFTGLSDECGATGSATVVFTAT